MTIKKPVLYLLLLLPLLLPTVWSSPYWIHAIICKIMIYAILVASLDLIVGYIGDVSIGHAGLFALGAYSVAILTATPKYNPDSLMTHFYGLPFVIALIIGILISALAGFILGFPALRLSGPYLAVVTIAYGILIVTIINEQAKLTNGTKGITLEPLKLGNLALSGNNYLYVVYPFLVLVMYMNRNLAKSYWGRAFEAIKYSEVAAACSGISKSYYKIWAFVISAGIAGLAGGLFAQFDAYVTPETFSYSFSVEFLIALIVGGVQSVLGNILGVGVYVLLPDLVNKFNDYKLIIFGVSLLLVLYFLPKGLAGWVNDKLAKFFPQNLKNRTDELIKKAAQVDLSEQNNLIPIDNNSENALNLKGLTMKFGGLVAVNQLDLKVKRGTVHGLIGPNGSGKSTTVNLLTGIYKPVEGHIETFDAPLTKFTTYKRAQKGLARTFQNLQLFSDLTALQNVMVGMHTQFKSNLLSVMLGFPNVKKEEDFMETKAFAWLQFVGIEHLAFEKSKNLAYGQARLLEIARAMAMNPTVLLLDEPAAGLTTLEIGKINDIIIKIRNSGVSILLIEHHMNMISAVSDEVTVLDFGKKIAEGTYAVVRNNPHVINAYLGNSDE